MSAPRDGSSYGLGDLGISILSILQDAPFVNYGSLRFLFNNENTLHTRISALKRGGFLETIPAASADVMYTGKLARITTRGRLALNEIQAAGQYKGKSMADERPEERVFISSGLPITGQSKSGVKTHFNRVHLVRLWLQLRFMKWTKFSVLWDYVKHPEQLPLLGSPDIIMHNFLDLDKCVFHNLVVVEWEFSEKSSTTIFQRLEELTRNHDAMFFLVVSSKLELLKRYATVVRKCVPGSSSYTGKRTFHPSFLNFDYHLKRLWFVHWDPSDHEISQSGIEDARCFRFDHDEFDLYGPIKEGYDRKKTRERIPFNRFQGRTEVKLSDIMRIVA